MEILIDTILEKKIKLSEDDLKLSIINYINSKYPVLITNEDFDGLDKDLIVTFKYDPYKK